MLLSEQIIENLNLDWIVEKSLQAGIHALKYPAFLVPLWVEEEGRGTEESLSRNFIYSVRNLLPEI